MATPSLLSPQEFAAKIRDKYPDAYDSVPDDELTQRVIRKYPQYASQVQLATTGAAQPQVNMQSAPMSGFQSTVAGLTEGPSGATGNVRNPKLEVPLTGEDPTGRTGEAISAVAAGGVAGAALPYVRPVAQPAVRLMTRYPVTSYFALEAAKGAAKGTPVEPYINKIPSVLPFLAAESSGLGEMATRRLGLSRVEGAATAEAGAARGQVLPPSTDQLPNRPYQPNPRYSPAPPSAEPIPSRQGLMLEGEVASPPPITRAEVEARLNEAMGGRPLQRNVPLRAQMPATRAGAAEVASVPAGFQPVQSSVLRGYRYDPAARELTSITNDGSTYIHGDVSPSDVAAFESAPSVGAGWNRLKSQGTLVAKVINGKRVSVRPTGLRSPNAESIANALRKRQ